MSTIVTMSSTVKQYQSGSVYRLRSREAEVFIKNAQATATGKRGSNSDTSVKEGK
jgi:hypothetical protein